MSNSNQVVRAKSFWKGRAVLSAIAFVVTGLAVHQMAKGRFEHTNVTPSATTIVYQAFAPDTAGQFPQPTSEEIKRQVLSDSGLQRAMAQRSDHASGYLLDAISQTRPKLRVVVSEDIGRNRFKISISAKDSDVSQAVALTNALAKQYADDHLADFRSTVETDYLHARNLAQQAERDLLVKKNQLDEFLRRHFENTSSRSVPAVPSPRRAGQFWGHADRSDRTIENPAWTDLSQQLLWQRKMRSDLAPVTPESDPRVRSLNDRIAELEQRLPITPRRIPEVAVVHPLPSINAPGQSREWASSNTAATLEEFSTYQEAVQVAADEHERLVLLERRAWKQRSLLPGVEVHPAQMPGTVYQVGSTSPSPRSILLALASALAMAAGVAMISSGVASDPALRDAAEVESILPAPLVGGIPARTPVASRPSTQGASGMTLLFYGMVLVMVCFGVLLALFGPGL